MKTPMSNLNHHPDADTSVQMLSARQQQNGYAAHQKWVRTLLEVESDDTVLEVGCGYGAHLPHLSAVSSRVVAVEPSNVLRARAQRGAPNVRVLAEPWESCTPGGPFSVILFDKVLTHLSDPVTALQKAFTVAAPDARILLVNLDGMSTTVNPGLDHDNRRAAEQILAWRAAHGTASGWSSTSAPSVLAKSGWQYTTTHVWALSFTTLEEAEHYTPLSSYGAQAYAENAVTQNHADRWLQMTTGNPNTFNCTLTVRADLAVRTT